MPASHISAANLRQETAISPPTMVPAKLKTIVNRWWAALLFARSRLVSERMLVESDRVEGFGRGRDGRLER